MSRRSNTSLYESDPHAWFFDQARLLRSGRVREADLPNIAEELETLGRSEAKELRSSLRLILAHLLKWQLQPERRSRSWVATIERERVNAESSLDENPSLRAKLDELFAGAWKGARRDAAAEMEMRARDLPERSPFTVAEVLEPEWLPEDADADGTGAA